MKVLKVRNVNEASFKGLQYLYQYGEREQSRAGPVLVAPEPVTTVYSHPQERVLFSAARDANPFFHLMEALWMLAGRSDAKWLDQFVSDFSERFAEERGQLHGAYGYRWRNAFGFDQLDYIVKTLKSDPTSRQCVLQMWEGSACPAGECSTMDDLRGNWRDRPCLAGDTIIWSPEGDLPISKIAEKFSYGAVRWPVYSVCPKTKTLRLKWATACWKTGKKQTTVITFDDGSKVRATSDHVFYRYPKRIGNRGNPGAVDARPVCVKDLNVGDRILATRRFFGRKGHEVIKKLLGNNTSFSNLQSTHNEYYTLVYGEIPEGCELHHVNEQKCDNRILNLEPLDPGDHSRYHKLGDNNPSRRMSPEQRAARGRKHSISLKKAWARLTPEQRVARSKGLTLPDNHKIVKIELGELEDVYDFTVPDFHTAIIGTGLIAHNCNTHVYFRVRKELINAHTNSTTADPEYKCFLDMTVCCRSNDIIWGAYGANAVHFSVLQEYMAARIGVGIGKYYQISNNYHMYLDMDEKAQAILTETQPQTYPDYLSFVDDPEAFDDDLKTFFNYNTNTSNDFTVLVNTQMIYANPFFSHVVEPMLSINRAWKRKQKANALALVQRMSLCDWRIAAEQWVLRRMNKS